MSARRIFGPVVLALVCAAVVGLPLFQDGSSYLFELLVTGSAVRHHRLSALLVQLPARLVAELLAAAPIDVGHRLRWVRAVFALSYATVPLSALALSWLVVRRRNPAMIVWPALIILFVNLVNFSWVSELWIAIQLCCPLLLASIVAPGTRGERLLAFALLPFVLLLHPLIALVLLVMAAGTAFVASRDPERRRAGRESAVLYLAAAVVRVLVSPLVLDPHETAFLETGQMTEYLFAASWPTVLLLASAVVIGIVCWRGRAVRDARRPYLACMVLAPSAAAVLLSYYALGARGVPLKTGLAVFAAALLMLLAALDGVAPPPEPERAPRLRLTAVLASVFAVVVVGKSLMWLTSVRRLSHVLTASGRPCLERDAGELAWVRVPPHVIIDNWSLPSLALVMHDHHPGAVLLEPGDCRRLEATGMVRVDPWSVLSTRLLNQLFGPVTASTS
jgi:hypothetical protein